MPGVTTVVRIRLRMGMPSGRCFFDCSVLWSRMRDAMFLGRFGLGDACEELWPCSSLEAATQSWMSWGERENRLPVNCSPVGLSWEQPCRSMGSPSFFWLAAQVVFQHA